MIKYYKSIVLFIAAALLFPKGFVVGAFPNLQATVSINSATNIVTVTGNVGEESAGKEAALVVLKDNSIPNTLSDIDVSNPMDKVFIVRQTTVDAEGNYVFSFYWDTTLEGGYFQFKVSVEGVRQSEEQRTTQYFFASEEQVLQALEIINNATINTIEMALAQDALYLNLQNPDYLQAKHDVHIKFLELRQQCEDGKISSTSETARILNSSIFYELIQSGRITSQKLENYGTIEGLKFNDDYYNVKESVVANIIRNKPSKIMSDNDIQTILNESVALAMFNIEGREAIIDVMDRYKTELQLDGLNAYKEYLKLSRRDKILVNVALSNKNFENINRLHNALTTKMNSLDKEGNGSMGTSSSTGSRTISAVTMPVVEAEKYEPQGSLTRLFDDLDEFNWAVAAITTFAENGYIDGVNEKVFAPNDNITREQFVKVLINSFGLFDKEAACDFEDCDRTQWYYEYVASAKKAGIIQGVSDNVFGAGEYLTRQDMSVILDRILKLRGITLKEADYEDEFLDFDLVVSYAKESVSLLKKAGIIKGFDDNTFGPALFCTRAEAIVLLHRLWEME